MNSAAIWNLCVCGTNMDHERVETFRHVNRNNFCKTFLWKWDFGSRDFSQSLFVLFPGQIRNQPNTFVLMNLWMLQSLKLRSVLHFKRRLDRMKWRKIAHVVKEFFLIFYLICSPFLPYLNWNAYLVGILLA